MDAKILELERLDSIMTKSDFWERNQDEVSRISQERAYLKDTVDSWEGLKKRPTISEYSHRLLLKKMTGK